MDERKRIENISEKRNKKKKYLINLLEEIHDHWIGEHIELLELMHQRQHLGRDSLKRGAL